MIKTFLTIALSLLTAQVFASASIGEYLSRTNAPQTSLTQENQ